MKVRCISNRFQLTQEENGHLLPVTDADITIWLDIGKIYEVIAVERKWYRLVDESGEDYLYPPDLFEVLTI